MDDNAVVLAALGLVGTLATGFFTLIRMLLKSVDKNTASNERVAKATERAALEAKERNGHIAELIVEQSKLTKQLTEESVKEIVSAVQHVDNQLVKHQTVEDVEHSNRKGNNG